MTDHISKYFTTPTGPRGGTIRGQGVKSKTQPPVELAASVESENSRRAALEETRIPNPIVALNREAQARAEFDESCEEWIGTDWVEREPKDSAEPLYYRVESFHWSIRASVVGPAGADRQNFILKVVATPWLPVSGLSPAQRKAAHNRKSNLWNVPSVNQSVREEFPSAIFALSRFLTTCRPVADFDISGLQAMAAPDVGHEDDQRPPEPKPVTLQDVLNGLAGVLNAQQKPAAL